MHHDPRQQVYAGITLEGLDVVAEAISKFASTYRVWLFKGEMGAGKTTLIKAVGAALGVTETMSSPTFSIVNQYEAGASGSIYHFDFYRIRSEAEAYDIGADEYFYSGSPCFIEWPEKIPTLIPATHGSVTIQSTDNTHRTIVITVHDGKEENRI
jgi:tRNA threonylcarbamoyladenosine biosynthesis protein TsaE